MIKHNYLGKFIVIEGLDGSGKSTQVDLLVSFLKKQGRGVVLTKEPTQDSQAGKKIRQILNKEIKIESLELQKLYIQDRKEHLENKVIPALKKGKFVVSSRYYFSTFAYGAAEGLNLKMLIDLNKNFLAPDLTIIIDVLPEDCVKRIESRGELKEYFEELKKLKKISEFYKKFPEIFENVFLINGQKSISNVFQQIKNLIKKEI